MAIAPPTLSIALVSDTGSSSTDRITSYPVVRGVGQPNTLIMIKEGGVTLGIAIASSTGAWSFIPPGLADGTHTLTATQTDSDGNTATVTLSFTLDRAAPVVSIALVSDTGSSSSDKITANPAVKGVGQANTLVTIKEGGVTLGTAMADGTGAWSFTPVGLADGAHTLSASQTDLAGNTATVTLSFTLDRAAPVVSIALVSDTGSSSSDKITANPAVKGVGQANTLVTIKEGGVTLGATTADGTGAWSFTPAGLTDGAHTLSASQTDLAGNTGAATLNFTLDSSQGNPPPALSIALVSDTGSSGSDKITSNSAVKGVGQANTLVTINEGGTTLGTAMADGTGAWSFIPPGLTDGGHTLTASQIVAGNTVLATVSFTLDRAAPVVSIALVADTGSSSSDKITSNPAVKGVGQANTLVTIKEGGVALGTTTADGSGAWSFTPVGLAEGAHVFSASQTDLAGNTGTATLNFTLDSSQGNPPPPPVLSMALFSDTGSSATDHITSKAAIKGTGYALTLVTIKEAGATIATVTADSSGNWGFTPALPDGAHTLTATQIVAGNTVTATLSFTLDRTAPVLSMALLSDDGGSSSDGITSNPAIRGVGDANSLLTIKEGAAVLGTVMTDGAGTWSFIQPGISVGARTLTATQTDLAGNTGTKTLSFTLAVPQPTQGGDIVGLLLQNTGAVVEESGYVTFGQVFKSGAVRPGDSLVARIGGVDYAVQMDVKATNSDGSVRHAVLTLNAPDIAPNGNLALMLAKGSAAMPSPAAPSAAALLAGGYNLDVAFTFRNAGGTTTTANASAAAALQAAITAGTVQRWLTGPEVNEYSVVTTVNGGKLKVEFDIRAYADGTTSTDVIFDNSWMFAPGKSNLTYDVAIRQDGQQVYGASNVFQYLYSLWDHRVDSAGTINPNVQYDNSYLIAAAALPAYDQSYRVSDTAIQKDYSRLDPSISAGYGSTGPMGTAEVTTYMPGTGGRPDIAPQPNWVAQWVLSQSSAAEAVMMANADASGGVPWHLIDENTGKPINSEDYPRFYEDPRNNIPGNAFWSPQPVNGWPTYGANGDPWTPDRAHIPDMNYVPYLISGSDYQLRLLQAAANFVDLNMPPDSKYNGSPGPSPNIPGSDIYLGLASWHNQARGIAWSLRQIAEAAYLTPDGDPQKAHFTTLLNDTMDGLVQYYVTGGYNDKFGDIQGFLMGWGEQYSQIVGPWMQDYIVTTFGEIAGMNIAGASDNAVKMLEYMDNFISGLYTRGSDGFNPYNGAAYYLKIIDPVTQAPVTSWAQLAQLNSADYPLNANSLPKPSYPTSAQGYAANARTALANIITYTQSPQAIEAYGFITGQIAVAWGRNPAGMVTANQEFPAWNVMPRLPDGEYLQASQTQIDVSNNPLVTLSAGNRDSLLSVVGTGTATLTGGSGGTDLLYGGSGPTTLIAGTGNDYLFAGSGTTTFVDNKGDDYMKAGSGADAFTFADVHPGHDTIVNFKLGTDLLKIAPNLDGIHVAGAAQLIAAATVVGGSTVLHFGPNHDVTMRGIDTPSTLIGSIVVS